MEENHSNLPRQIELKKKLIICPKCKAEIEVDLTIDITPITDLIGAFGTTYNPGGGYQPNKGNLDPQNPPKGGSGVPKK